MSKVRVYTGCQIEFKGASPARDMLERAGFEVVFLPPSPGSPDEETRSRLAGVHALIAGSERVCTSTLEKADSLRIVARNGVGYDRVDLEACTARGIMVTNTPGAMADAVADQAMALILALVRQVASGDRTVKAGGYSVAMGEDLAALTLGLVGCGRIGAEVVRRALAFKMRVLAHDPGVSPAVIAGLGAAPVSLEELLSQSDVVSLHLPLARESEGLADAGFLGRMRPGSLLINTARGGLVDEAALIAALAAGHLAGAGLDCQATEPPQGTSLELVRMEQVVALPHSGSKTYAARQRMAVMAAQSILDCLQGRVPQHLVNREVLER